MKHLLKAAIILNAVDNVSGVMARISANGRKTGAELASRSSRIAAGSKAAIAASAAVAAAGYAALRPAVTHAMDFEHAIGVAGAVARASSEDVKKLALVARLEGRRTMYTAMESADALKFLSMAGLSTQKSIKALPGVLDLATAGSLDLASSADIATSILKGFGKSESELAAVNDVLVRTFTSSKTNLQDLGETMKYAAPIGSSLTGDFTDMAAMAGKLAEGGIKGQMAGTALRGVYLRLAGPTTTAAKALEYLGVTTTDAKGNLRDMLPVLGDIGRAMAKLPSGRRAGLLRDIFETEGASAAAILTRAAATGELQRYRGGLTQGPGAAEMAARIQDSTFGKYKELNSAIQDLAIVSGNVLLPALKEISIYLAGVVRGVSDWMTANPELAGGIVKFAAAATGIVAVLGTVATAVYAVSVAFGFLAGAGKIIAGVLSAVVGGSLLGISAPIWLLGAAITAAGVLIYKNWEKIKAFFVRAGRWLKEAGLNFMTMLKQGIISGAGLPFYALYQALKRVRKLLPSSPAELGPLSDIHKLKFTETVAKSITAQPLIKATDGVLNQTFNRRTPAINPSGGGRGATISYAPTINLTGAGEDMKQQIYDMLKAHSRELGQIIRAQQANQNRLSY